MSLSNGGDPEPEGSKGSLPTPQNIVSYIHHHKDNLVKNLGPAFFVLIGALIPCTALWARAGTYFPWQHLLVKAAFITLGVLLAKIVFLSSTAAPGTRLKPLRTLLRDPITWLGIVFLIFLALQWFNAGRIRIFDMEAGRWCYSNPKFSGLPSAVTRRDAQEMLHWFFPAWVLLLYLRQTLSRQTRIILLNVLILNAAIHAVYGINVYLDGSQLLMGQFPFEQTEFFGAFGYPNHAASFYVLLTALAVGLTFDHLLEDPARRSTLRVAVYLAAALLFALAATATRSRAGMLLSWGLISSAAVYLIYVSWPISHPVSRINTLASVVFFALLGGILLWVAAPADLWSEMGRLPHIDWLKEWNLRTFQTITAFEIFQDHPFYGTGGWGYRYFVGFYADPDQWGLLMNAGKANVHNDSAQFLCEFGLLGSSLLTATLVLISWPLLRRLPHPQRLHVLVHQPLAVLFIAGLLLISIHSLIDLPFRSPAVLTHWLFTWILLRDALHSTPAMYPYRGMHFHPDEQALTLADPRVKEPSRRRRSGSGRRQSRRSSSKRRRSRSRSSQQAD